MKNNIIIIKLILLGIIFANILVYYFNVNSINSTLIIIIFISVYKASISKKFTNIYNIHSFKYTLTNNNILELIGAFFTSLIANKDYLILSNFNIKAILFCILFGLLIYRFMYYNLSKK